MRSLLLLATLLCACATDPADGGDEVIDLSPDGKQDGFLSTVVTLESDASIGLTWLCNEQAFELNGCTIDLTITVSGSLPAGTPMGTLVHNDLNSDVTTNYDLVVGENKMQIQAAKISSHAAKLTNSSPKRLVFSLHADWW